MKSGFPLLTVTETIAAIIFCVLIILFSIAGSFQGLYSVFSFVSQGIQADSFEFFNSINEEIAFIDNLGQTKSERDRLETENQKLISEIADLKEELKDQQDIVRQLQFDLPFKLEPARVIRYDSANAGEIIINKGTESKLEVGDPVVIDNIAIGEIIEVLDTVSRVKLITAPNTLIPVVSQGSDTKGIVTGNFGIGLRMNEILNESKIKEGEIIVTTGVNSGFPRGLIVGRVDFIESVESELTKSARVKTIVNYSSLTNIFVITN